ncbi:helix-turn-helix domain-containing protein [Aeromonas salmonicida]|uniref:helix-turn-helix domain-containing protein n=1 Tax=Aeromonas salmonicida TaxID=645 RepID=UPI0038D38313
MPPLQISDYIDDYIHEWIESNLDELVGLDMLSARLGYCKRTIQQHFKQRYGISIGCYIRLRRLHRAAVMLRMTTLSVTDISSFLHYTSHNNFCRAFKKVYNKTPLAFRKENIQHCDNHVKFPKMLYNYPLKYKVKAINDMFITGGERSYSDCIYNLGIADEKLKWIKEYFTKESSPLTIASKVIDDSYSLRLGKHGSIKYNAIVGELIPQKESDNRQVKPMRGLYLCSFFHGTVNAYQKRNADIRRHLLPDIGFTLRNEHKVEIFHFCDSSVNSSMEISCEQFIPIIESA